MEFVAKKLKNEIFVNIRYILSMKKKLSFCFQKIIVVWRWLNVQYKMHHKRERCNINAHKTMGGNKPMMH